MNAVIYQSPREGKKYRAVIAIKDQPIHIVDFGATGYSDYTLHRDDMRKQRYLQRHHKEDWTDYKSAGFWSRWLLWNKKTLRGSARDIKKRFDISVKV